MSKRTTLLMVLILCSIVMVSAGSKKKSILRVRKNLGLEYDMGYYHYIPRIYDPWQYIKYIHPLDLSFEGSINYLHDINKNFAIKPFIGFARFRDNRYDPGLNTMNLKITIQSIFAGATFEYKVRNFRPQAGICCKRVIKKHNFYRDDHHQYDQPLLNRNLFQLGVGGSFVLKDFSVGVFYWRNISWITPAYGGFDFAFREYLLTMSWYPWRRALTTKK